MKIRIVHPTGFLLNQRYVQFGDLLDVPRDVSEEEANFCRCRWELVTPEPPFLQKLTKVHRVRRPPWAGRWRATHCVWPYVWQMRGDTR